MKKMETPVLQVIRFGAADVIATSGTGIDGKWSAKSYLADSGCSLAEIYWTTPETENYLDGVAYGGEGDDEVWIFEEGDWYHYDEDSLTIEVEGIYAYTKWKSCTDPSHHSN